MDIETLCEIEDVKNESISLINVDTYDSVIESKLEGATIEVFNDSEYDWDKLDSLDGDRYTTVYHYLKMAAICKILSFLESKGLIKSSNSEVTSIRDSQVSVSFQRSQSKKTSEVPESYDEQYKYYIGQVRPLPPVGGSPKRNRYCGGFS